VRVDPVLAGLVGATVVLGGGLVAYGSSQPTEAPASPAPVVQRDDAVTARALAVVEELASAGEDGAPSAPAAARRAAHASLRGKAVDPFRGRAKAGSGAAPGGTAPTDATRTGPGADATSAADRARDAVTRAAAAAAAASGRPGAAVGGAPGAGSSGTAPAGSATGGSGSGGSGVNGGSGSAGGSSTTPGAAPTADPAVVGATGEGDAAVARRLAAELRAQADRLRRLEAERLASAPARVSLRVGTVNGKRVRDRLELGTLLPNRAHAVAGVVRVARDNRTITLRLREGARLAGPQSPGTRCVLWVEGTDQCRLIHVRVGKAAVIQGADIDGAPGPVTALRVLSVWRGETRVPGE
jgi:hypothetical protein